MMDALRKRRGTRGATLVEYALAIAFIAVVSLGAIAAIQSRSRAELSSRGAEVGTVTDHQFYASSGSGSPPGPTAPPPTPPVSPGTSLHIQSATASPNPTDDNSKWTAFATIVIFNDLGAPISGVTVTGSWSDGTGPTFTATCVTTESGGCTVQFNNINDNIATVTYTVSSLAKPSYTFTPSGSDAPPVVVDCATVSGICSPH